MRLNFDYYHNLEQVDLFLCNPDGRELFPLPGQKRNLTLRFNDLSELTFEITDKTTLSDGNEVELEVFDYVQTKRLVYATNVGWFQITAVDEHDDGEEKYKTVTCESYQSVLKNKGFISEERVYCFYNPNDPFDDKYDASNNDSVPSVLGQWSKQLGIKISLGQGLADPEEPYDDWTVTYIHSSLIYTGADSICRTFKENTTYGYDWIINDVEDAFEVIVLFDFMYKAIHVMIPSEITEKANVIYTFNNFMKNIEINEASEDIVTVLNCHGDNCDITAVNPTGTNYICDFSYYMDTKNYRWMSKGLIDKINEWKAACATEKDTYTKYVSQLRSLYQQKTEKETVLQEMSLSLQDLRNAQNKRSALGSGTAGALCGIVCAETVVSGNKSIKSDTDYYSSAFDGSREITAYPYSPRYNTETKTWDFSNSGTPKSGTADSIIAANLADSNTTGVSHLYFSDTSDNSSYCKLKSSVRVDKDASTSEYYCGGFERFIAYCYPIVGDESGVTTYTDSVQSWINLREGIVNSLNKELYGYASAAQSGFDADGHITITTSFVKDSDGDYIESKLPIEPSICYQINQLVDSIDDITSRLNILSYFAKTPALLRELNCYWIEGDYTNENIAVLEETTLEKEIDLSNELLEAGYIELSKVCQPHFSFSIDSVDATKNYEFRNQMRELELGKIITIEKEEGLWFYPALLEISISLDNSDEFSMTFANAMRLDDWGYTYADLISDASSTSRQVSANWQDILAYAKERERITSLIKDPLNATLRASFANMVNQDFVIDKSGILGRKRASETSDEFEKEQVRLINNLLIFTDDNWETAKTALGKICYTDDDGNQVTSYGLIAETIIGSLIMGERLKIKNTNSTVELGAEGITIKKKNTDNTYSVVFSAKPDGSLVVNGYATLDVAKEMISAKVSSIGGDKSSFAWELTSSGFYLYSSSMSPVMSVTSSGAVFAGSLSAVTGTLGDLTVTGRLTFGGDDSYYIDANYDDSYYYVNLPGLCIDKASGAVFSGSLSAANGTFNGTITSIGDGEKGTLTIDNGGIDIVYGTYAVNELGWKTSIGSFGISICGSYTSYNASSLYIYDNTIVFNYAHHHDSGWVDMVSGPKIYHNGSGTAKLSGTWVDSGGTAISSDANEKNSIEQLDDRYDVFFDSLQAERFKYNSGTSNRYHTGFITQKVQSSLAAANIDESEFAGIITFDNGSESEEVGQQVSSALRYHEFISLNTWQIQKLKARIAELETIVAKLQEG